MILEDAKNYLRIDDDSENTYVQSLIDVSQIYVDSMVGENYKTDEKAIKLAELLCKKLIADMYENRGSEIANNTKQDRIVTSILDYLSVTGD